MFASCDSVVQALVNRSSRYVVGLVGTKSFVLTDAPTRVSVFRLSSVAVRARSYRRSHNQSARTCDSRT